MYNDLQLRAFTQIAYIDLESKYNLLLNANHDLKNRYLHIYYNKNFQSAKMTLLEKKMALWNYLLKI